MPPEVPGKLLDTRYNPAQIRPVTDNAKSGIVIAATFADNDDDNSKAGNLSTIW
jgi:hypothetical protein